MPWSSILPHLLPFPLLGMHFFNVANKVELMAFPDALQSDKTANTQKEQMNFNARQKG